ncbi:MFS transporter [Companilactobacillus keshanensis]|uniref:MFS transporter n=1 Tax=Companilactobacillus keshanensis TaxID=2486003 RepID=A0ABW4BWB5_9LACO|nr:MFS transporter [Companilactobacillus keshanensis]
MYTENAGKFKEKLILVAMTITGFMVILDTNIMNITIPDIQSGLNVSLSDLSWAINIYTILFASFLIPFGRLGDKIGHVKLLNTAIIVFAAGSIVSGMSQSLTMLIIGRSIQSIGAAVMLPSGMIIEFHHSTMKQRGKIVSIFAATQAMGAALGPSIGGLVAQFMGWHWVFLINIPVVVLVLIINIATLSMKNEQVSASKIDIIGAVLIALTLFLMTLGLVQGRNWGWTSATTIGTFVTGLISLVAFIYHDKHTSDPIVPLSLFKDRNFVASTIMILLSFTFLASFVGIMPTYLTKIMGVSELHAGLLITPMSAAMLVATPIATNIIEKINVKIPLTVGILSTAVGVYLLSKINVDNSWSQLYIIDILIGIGVGCIAGPALSLGINKLQGADLTSGQNVLNVLRNVGAVIGIALFLSLLDGNITTAKQDTYDYSVRQVQKIDVAKGTKNKIDNKLHNKLVSSSTQISNGNKKIKTMTITNSAKNTLVNETYNKLLLQKQMAGVSVPAPMKLIMYKTVEQKADASVLKINDQISTATHNIKHHLTVQLKDSFKILYSWELPAVLISLLGVFIYKNDPNKIK